MSHPAILQLSQNERPLRRPWKNAIAVGRAGELLRNDVLEHLRILQTTIGYGRCRFHGLFHDEMGAAIRRPDGRLAFRWQQIDKVLDSLQALGLDPFVELGPMPSALASGTQTIFDWKMNVTPPRDYHEWGCLVEAFTRHVVERYGLERVSHWLFEVWNEPNLPGFWSGTQEEYFLLYETSARAVKRVDDSLRVGGPATSRASWLPVFIGHCAKNRVPIDFITSHLYPQDENIQSELEFAGSANFFVETMRHAKREVESSPLPRLPIHWTEWNSLSCGGEVPLSWTSNPTVDSIFSAAMICDACAGLDEECETLCWWAASDVFEESGMPHAEFSRTYGLLTPGGLPKASFHAFAFLNRLRGAQLIPPPDWRPPSGSGLLATREGSRTHVLLWNRILLGHEQPGRWTAHVRVPDLNEEGPLRAVRLRIRPGAGSAWETWNQLGCPQDLTPAERSLLVSHSTPEADLISPDPAGCFATALAPGEVAYLEIGPPGQAALPKTPERSELERWEKAMADRSR